MSAGSLRPLLTFQKLMNDQPYKSLANELLSVQRTLGWMDLVISSISDAVCVIDEDGNIIFANDYFANIVDQQRVFLLGKSYSEIFPIKESEKISNEYAVGSGRLRDEGDKAIKIYEWIDANNRTLIFRISSRHLPQLQQTVYLIQNITQEYELTKMKNTFIDLASHQLRTPMTAVIMYSHMLKDGYAGTLLDEQKELADTIVTSSERMVHLVDGLLSITRAQSGVHTLNNRQFALADIFKRIETEVKPRTDEKEISLELKIPSTIKLFSDVSVLQEIFSNLIVNAIQYTLPKGYVNVSALETDHSVVVSIQDTGIGIPPEFHSTLFDQFIRADNAAELYSEGTGLGLYLVKLLLGKIGGTIHFDSEVNIGTTFTVELPKKSGATA